MASLVIRASHGWLGLGRVLDDVRVVCEGGAVVSAGTDARVGAEAELVVDGFLMPAAADRHVHIELADPAAVLRGGVTAVRDLAWPTERILPLAALSELPTFDGPLIRPAGPMLTGRGGYPSAERWAPPGTARELDGPDDAAEAVRELHGLGATAIKVSLNAEAGPTPTDAELAAICDAAHGLELPVTAHAQGRGQVDRALGAGIDELAHTPWTERLPEDTIRRCAAALRIVSTLDILGRGSSTPELVTALDNLGRFHRAGGEVVYGTDLGNGSVPPGIHTRELRLLLDAGLTVDQVLSALVRAPLEPGAPADLIALRRNPFDDVAAFDQVVAVVRGGRVIAPPGRSS
jgi:imidazolonepropionase-like amidohydrolase